jgi:hypothetical protein
MTSERTGLSGSAKTILACTIILVVFLSFAMFFMWKYLGELSGSPLVVGAQKTAEANDATDVMCTCQIFGRYDGQTPNFYFNTSSIWNDPPKRIERDYPEINFSNVEIIDN